MKQTQLIAIIIGLVVLALWVPNNVSQGVLNCIIALVWVAAIAYNWTRDDIPQSKKFLSAISGAFLLLMLFDILNGDILLLALGILVGANFTIWFYERT